MYIDSAFLWNIWYDTARTEGKICDGDSAVGDWQIYTEKVIEQLFLQNIRLGRRIAAELSGANLLPGMGWHL